MLHSLHRQQMRAGSGSSCPLPSKQFTVISLPLAFLCSQSASFIILLSSDSWLYPFFLNLVFECDLPRFWVPISLKGLTQVPLYGSPSPNYLLFSASLPISKSPLLSLLVARITAQPAYPGPVHRWISAVPFYRLLISILWRLPEHL